jgi:hypothetical protein
MGMLFLFAGYFIHTDNIPQSVRWISWLMPSRYALEGSLNNVFGGQMYYNPTVGVWLTGETLLQSVFAHDSNTLSKWANFVVVIAWTLLFRVMHLGMTMFNNRSFGRAPAGSTPDTSAGVPMQARGRTQGAPALREEEVLVIDAV